MWVNIGFKRAFWMTRFEMLQIQNATLSKRFIVWNERFIVWNDKIHFQNAA